MNVRRLVALGATALLTTAVAQVVPLAGSVGAPARPAASAGPRDDTGSALGNGLGRLVAQEQARGARRGPGGRLVVDQSDLAIRDDEGRVLVQVTPAAEADRAAFGRSVAALGFERTADDERSGTLEGFAPLDRVTALSALPDLGGISQVLKPVTAAGDVTSQGVPFQRVDKVLARGVGGEGITVGVLSDSYDTAELGGDGEPIATRAADDVASGDLPGVGNPDGDTDPVVVIEDYDDGATTDEGRGMMQIVHDVAPRARLCFATAFSGDIGFADNIRALADRDGPCRADVIVDDVYYFNEPFFSDGVISAAVDDVTAAGVSYFSSAGNNGDQAAWRSRVDLVPPARVPAAARAADLDFSEVDPSLYAGGLQDMAPGGARDVAQTLQLDPGGGIINLQWADPVDRDGPELGEPLLADEGVLTEADADEGVDFTFTAGEDLVGTTVLFRTDAVPSGTTDLVLDVTTPSGEQLGPIDTGASPEVIPYEIEEAGDHIITVSGFDGATGDFIVDVSEVISPSTTTTDFNALLFTESGDYVGAFGEDNTLTGNPGEVLAPNLSDDEVVGLQLVIANATAGPTPVAEIGYSNAAGVYTEEYFDPTAPATFGHATAAGANGIAAIDPFKPYLPETYTSPGGALTFYFNRNGQRLRNPQTRLKPDVASTDGGNTTFFFTDTPLDADDTPNFFGTSAAAPHAAGIAALMLDRAGGPGALTPGEVTSTLKRTAYAHDLDPFRATGAAGGLRVTAVGPGGDERDASPASLDDPEFFRVSYRGRQPVRRLTFFARTASPTALGPRPGAPSAGLVFDPRPLAARGDYRSGGFPFTVGRVSGGLRRGSVVGRPLDRVGATRFHRQLRVRFDRGLRRGQSVRFGIDRDLRFPGGDRPPIEGNGADEIGGAVFLPRGRARERGMRFVAELAGGRRITGYVSNDLGKGFSPVTGYGVADAYAAVFAD